MRKTGKMMAFLIPALLMIGPLSVQAADADTYLSEMNALYRYAWDLEYPENGPYDVMMQKNGDYGGCRPVYDNQPVGGPIAFQVKDYDQDGSMELLVVRAEAGEWGADMVLQMYEVSDGQVELVSEVTADIPSFVPEAGIVHCFTYETKSGDCYIGCDEYAYVGLCADGITAACAFYRYDGEALTWENGCCIAGSEFSGMDITGSFASAGVWNVSESEVLSGSRTACDYLDGTEMIVEIERTILIDYISFYTRISQAADGESMVCGEMYIRSCGWIPDDVARRTWGSQVIPQQCLALQYILPDSAARYLTAADLDGLTAEELRIARNEILARHGRIFSSDDLNEYFSSKSWYQGTIEGSVFDSTYQLSEIEEANLALIQSVEEAR